MARGVPAGVQRKHAQGRTGCEGRSSLSARRIRGSRSPASTCGTRLRPCLIKIGPPVLRFGERVMALVGALCIGLHDVVGDRLPPLSRPGGRPARTAGQHPPDQLRPHPATPRRTARTPSAQQHLPPDRRCRTRAAILHIKVHVLRPLLAANVPPASTTSRDALRSIDRHSAGLRRARPARRCLNWRKVSANQGR